MPPKGLGFGDVGVVVVIGAGKGVKDELHKKLYEERSAYCSHSWRKQNEPGLAVGYYC